MKVEIDLTEEQEVALRQVAEYDNVTAEEMLAELARGYLNRVDMRWIRVGLLKRQNLKGIAE